ncbi:MAG: hypothetical protein LUH58_00440 [Lachnospiraceae bacterium]|nr:hypothetical protein [Lachnospiraceae bacterium]
MILKNLKLTLASVVDNPSDGTLDVVETSVQYAWENGKRTDTVLGYKLEVIVRRGDTLTVKVPADLSEKVSEVEGMLRADEEVEVVFKGLKLKAYAMASKDGVRSGVSATAEDFEIVNEIDEFSDIS